MSSVNLKRQQKINSQMGEVMDDFDRFEFFLANHWKKIVIVAILAVVAVAVYVTVASVMQNNRRDAALAYAKAKNAAELEQAISKFSNAPGAIYLQLAGMYINSKDYDKARAALVKAAADDSDVSSGCRAKLNLAGLDELQGKYAEAAAAFADFAKSCREPGCAVFAAEAYAAAGRNYLLAKDKSAAKNILEAGRAFVKTLPAEDVAASRQFGMIIAGLLNDAR